MLPMKNLLKHRRKLLVSLLVAVLFISSYCLQVTVFHGTPITGQLPWLQRKLEHPVTSLLRNNVLPKHHESIPNLHQLLKKTSSDIYVAPHCIFPPDNSSSERVYHPDVTRVEFRHTEKTIFNNLTDNIRVLTQRANQLLSELNAANRSGITSPSPSGGDLPGLPEDKEMEKLESRRQRLHGPSRDPSLRFGVHFRSHLYFPGGHWIPTKCKPKWKVAIIVPFRNRTENLNTFIRNMVPFLLQQDLEFGIFVAEQGLGEVMNRGLMRNIGYQTARYSGTLWDCYVFHDVDYVPINATNYYGCDGFPKHFAVNLEEFKYGNPFLKDFGGVVGLTAEQVEMINGYSNMYWGWGGEDDDILKRLVDAGRYNVTRSNEGFYRNLPHAKKSQKEICRERFCLGSYATKRIDTDGVSAIRYHRNSTSVTLTTLFTKITTNVSKESWNYGYAPCQMAAYLRNNLRIDIRRNLNQWHLAHIYRRSRRIDNAATREGREQRHDLFVFVCILGYVFVATCICDCVQRTTGKRGKKRKQYFIKKRTVLIA